jgi:hypothetical protein
MNAVSARFSSSALMIDDGSFRLGKNVAVMRVNCQGTVKLWTVRSARGDRRWRNPNEILLVIVVWYYWQPIFGHT